jgi:hypothetical protein
MPSREGIEIEVALEKGFREDRLHVVDDNPANVAVLKRKYKQINTYGVSAARACYRIRRSGVRLRAANFDFTGCVGNPLVDELWAIAGTNVFTRDALVAVTLLRGREGAHFLSQIDEHALGDVRGGARWHLSKWKALGPQWQCRGVGRNLTERDWGRLFYIAVLLGLFGQHFHPIRVGCYPSSAGSQTMLFSVYRSDKRRMDRLRFTLDERFTFDVAFAALNGEGMVKNGKKHAKRLGDYCERHFKDYAVWFESCGHEFSAKLLRWLDSQ